MTKRKRVAGAGRLLEEYKVFAVDDPAQSPEEVVAQRREQQEAYLRDFRDPQSTLSLDMRGRMMALAAESRAERTAATSRQAAAAEARRKKNLRRDRAIHDAHSRGEKMAAKPRP